MIIQDHFIHSLFYIFPVAAGQQTLVLMTVRGRQNLKVQGPRLNLTKEDKMQVRHGTDRRLDPIVTALMPLMEVELDVEPAAQRGLLLLLCSTQVFRLLFKSKYLCVCVPQVFFLQFPTALLCGEIRKAHVEFCNVSAVPLGGVHVASTHPDFFTFGSQASTPPIPASAENCSAYKSFATNLRPGSEASESLVSAEQFGQPSGGVELPLQGRTLQPGESIRLPLWLRGPDQEGVHEINFLFYYESSEKLLQIR